MKLAEKFMTPRAARYAALTAPFALAALVAACGGGGGGGGGGTSAPAPAPVPKAAVLAVSSPVASQAASGQSQLVFRTTLLAEPTFPADMTFAITGATAGSSCGAGVDYVISPAANVSVAAGGAGGTLALASAASERLITVLVCPGSGSADKTLAMHWADPSKAGDTTGVIRASANLALDKSKRLNDTGIITCANGSSTTASCPQAGFAGQDADFGRDVSVAITGVGANRTSAFALSSLASGACVQDSVTGLVWESKTTSGLHAAASTYTWLLTGANSANGGAVGNANGGVCTASGCDTEKFVAAVNLEATCGFSDWRLPTADELGGIVDAGAAAAPTIRPQFANQAASAYWSASPKAGDSAGAWAVDFNSGAIGALAKSSANRVRLVRGH
jgi:hypothetical protein